MKYQAKFDEYRTFGVEIEFISPSMMSGYDVAGRLTALSGLPCSFLRYTHEVRSEWKLVTDASVRSGFELVSPPLSGEDGLSQVRTMMHALVEMGCSVDRSCGFHVHQNVRDLSYDQMVGVVAFYTQFESVIDLLHSPSRRGNLNTFCVGRYWEDEQESARQLRSAAQSEKANMWRFNYESSNRYRKVNTASFGRYGTIEFRQHAGTLNGEKAVNWILLTQLFVTKAMAGVSLGTRAKVSFGEFVRALRLAEHNAPDASVAHLAGWMKRRIEELSR